MAYTRTRSLVLTLIAALVAATAVVAGGSAGFAESSFDPVSTPTVNGTPAVGQTLTAIYAQSVPAAETRTVVWMRGELTVGSGDTYTLTADDLGATIVAEVIYAKGGYYPTSGFSEPVGPVAAGTIAFTPTITGTVAKGYTLTAAGLPSDATLSYRWKRNGASISGAVNPTYKLTSTDIGKTITVAVTAKRTAYATVTRTSAATAAVKNTFTAAYTPRISGTAKVGYVLKATTTAWSPTATLKYQWYRNGVAITGSTSSTRTLNGSDAGAIITVKATGYRSGYLTVAKTSAGTAVVAKASITAPTPLISGTARAGATLRVTLGTVSPSTVTKAYQWYRNGVAVAGATGTSYSLKNVDAGKKITFKATYSKTGYNTKVVTSAATVTIAKRTASMVSEGVYTPELPGTEYYVGPGIYIADSATASCYWERDDYDTFEIITAFEFPARWMVQIFAGDVFYSEGCGSWIKYDGTGAQATSITKTGMYKVNVDILPGVYQVSDAVESCTVTYESDASQEPYAVYKELYPLGGGEVVIDPSDVYIGMWGCGTLTRVGDVPPTP